VFPAPAFLMLDTGNSALIVLVIVLGFVSRCRRPAATIAS
jgi:hypothetical protein